MFVSVSRAQWCCLTAVLAVVLALFCGPGAAAAGDDRPAARAAVGAETDGGARTSGDAGASADGRASADTEAVDAAASVTATAAVTLTATDADAVMAPDSDSYPDPVPGCGKSRNADDAPALPGRARAGSDHAPGLAEWGLPVATGPEPVGPRVRIRPRGPAPAAPTPVELSVLRV
ncbi:hypothetical protein ABT218_07165 [Streptomyces sp. NPDC001455]|uniref:hypothetical protein n=1 Tax=unclassified Streptomyces TaxID=2593676 RepID=UPI00331E2D22